MTFLLNSSTTYLLNKIRRSGLPDKVNTSPRIRRSIILSKIANNEESNVLGVQVMQVKHIKVSTMISMLSCVAGRDDRMEINSVTFIKTCLSGSSDFKVRSLFWRRFFYLINDFWHIRVLIVSPTLWTIALFQQLLSSYFYHLQVTFLVQRNHHYHHVDGVVCLQTESLLQS